MRPGSILVNLTDNQNNDPRRQTKDHELVSARTQGPEGPLFNSRDRKVAVTNVEMIVEVRRTGMNLAALRASLFRVVIVTPTLTVEGYNNPALRASSVGPSLTVGLLPQI